MNPVWAKSTAKTGNKRVSILVFDDVHKEPGQPSHDTAKILPPIAIFPATSRAWLVRKCGNASV